MRSGASVDYWNHHLSLNQAWWAEVILNGKQLIIHWNYSITFGTPPLSFHTTSRQSTVYAQNHSEIPFKRRGIPNGMLHPSEIHKFIQSNYCCFCSNRLNCYWYCCQWLDCCGLLSHSSGPTWQHSVTRWSADCAAFWCAAGALLANRSGHRDSGFFSQTTGALQSRRMLTRPPCSAGGSLGRTPWALMHCTPVQ